MPTRLGLIRSYKSVRTKVIMNPNIMVTNQNNSKDAEKVYESENVALSRRIYPDQDFRIKSKEDPP